jgi:hypothetical protein
LDQARLGPSREAERGAEHNNSQKESFHWIESSLETGP